MVDVIDGTHIYLCHLLLEAKDERFRFRRDAVGQHRAPGEKIFPKRYRTSTTVSGNIVLCRDMKTPSLWNKHPLLSKKTPFLSGKQTNTPLRYWFHNKYYCIDKYDIVPNVSIKTSPYTRRQFILNCQGRSVCGACYRTRLLT